MKLRGITTKDEVEIFDMKDCPVVINDSDVILINRPNSPILKVKSIAMGLDDLSMFETDYVCNDKNELLGYVVYEKGFKMYDINLQKVVPLPDKFVILTNIKSYDLSNIDYKRRFIKFVSNGIDFTIYSIVVAENSVAYVSAKCIKSVNLNDVKFTTGYKIDGKDICFDDTIDGGVVVLNNYVPMIKIGNEYIELKGDDCDE